MKRGRLATLPPPWTGGYPLARQMGPGHTVVTVLTDGGARYQSKLFNQEFLRERNLPAQVFFRRHDFKATRVLRNYYEDSGEDAFQMEYRVGAEFDDEYEGPVNRIAQYEEN